MNTTQPPEQITDQITELRNQITELRNQVEKIRRKVLPTETETEKDAYLEQVMRDNLRNLSE